MPGVVDTTHTFTTNEVITSALMNNIIDQTLFTNDALSGGTLALVSGKMKVATSGITSNEIASNAVTTSAIASSSSASTGVTYAKMQYVANMKALGNVSGSLGVVSEVSILDEDNMASDSATALATQQSIKAYTESYTTTYVDSRYVLDTVKAATSGTSIDFTGIPSWVKRITVMLGEVSTSGTAVYRVRLGTSGGFETTGYISTATDSGGSTSATDGLIALRTNTAASLSSGVLVISKLTGNKWVYEGSVVSSGSGQTNSSAGYKSLGGVLTQISVLTNGTDTFDAGEINISYE